MKLITTLLATMFAFSVYATEPAKPAGPEKAPDGMLLAKKKDHSNDKPATKPAEKKEVKK